VAQGSSGRKPTGPQNNKGSSGGSSAKSAASKQSGKQQSISRKSVAQARTSNNNNRIQLIIGAVAIVVIAAIIIIGIVMNQKETAVQNAGYGASTKSVATESGGVVAASNPTPAAGTTPKVIDLYEDALCPVCSEFEAQFGQQINQAVDEGKLTVNVHMLTFLDPRSFSQTYSTRAAAALLCVAQEDGSTPGVYMGFHSALFAADTQPKEGGSSDLTDQQLADLATSKGASDAAAECITSAQNVAAATAADKSSSATLSAATGGKVGTPTVVQNGVPVKISADWLTTLLAQQ
jgi:protein-disulfide isomerase